MKKHLAAVAAALTLLSLCGGNNAGGNEISQALDIAANLVNPEVDEANEMNEAAAESTACSIEEPAPPALQIEADYGGSVSAYDLTLGSYSWEKDGVHTESVSASAVAKAELGLISAVVDTSGLSGKVKLTGDSGDTSKIRSVTCYRDDTDFKPCEFEGNEITLSDEGAYNVYSVLVDFPEGSCEYMFRTENSAVDGNTPPMLRLCANDIYYALPQCSYHWNNAIACGDTAWSIYSHGFCPEIPLGGAAKAWISLPDNAEITAVCYDENGKETPLPVEKGTIDLPEHPNGKAYSITLTCSNGEWCEYIFGGARPPVLLPPDII